jgi:hypothetical protein
MVPEGRELPLDPTPFVALFFFGVLVALVGTLYESRLLKGLGILTIAGAALGFPIAEWYAQ